METKPLGGWCCAAAWATEGCVCLAALLPRLTALWLLNGALSDFVPVSSPAQIAAIGGLLLIGWLNGAMRLGRFAWYAALTACRSGEWPNAAVFMQGWRRVGAAIVWRIGLWLRRYCIALSAAFPPLLLLQLGQRLTPDEQTAIWWLGGAALLALLTGGLALLWLCRYTAAPVFLLEGCSGGEALRRSARLMRTRRKEYLNFLGDWAGQLLPCLLLLPVVWLLPQFRYARTALLLRWRQEDAENSCNPPRHLL